MRWSAILLILLRASMVSGQTLAWDANVEPPTLAGYQVLSGPTSGQYTAIVTLGKVTSYPLPLLTTPTYFAVKAVGADGLVSASSAEVLYTPAVPVPTPDPVPNPTPVPVPAPAPVTCKDGTAIFPQGYLLYFPIKVTGAYANSADYKAVVAQGWTYIAGTAQKLRANYYNLQFRCGN